MMQTDTVDFEAIKERQKMGWEAGDYPRVGNTLQLMAERLVEAADVHAGQRVLDVACGQGNAAIAAARRFADSTGVDYATNLLAQGRERAAAEHLAVTFTEGDAEQLPFPQASFDATLSTVGVMFAPDQERAATELVRVTRAGGNIALASWTPEGLGSACDDAAAEFPEGSRRHPGSEAAADSSGGAARGVPDVAGPGTGPGGGHGAAL